MKKIIPILALVLLVTSCGSYKRLAYLQDMNTEEVYEVKQSPQTRIQRGDILTIQVLSSQPILAAPFNITAASIATDSVAYADAKAPRLPEYTVDDKGRISFPVLGPVWVEGLTINELTATLVDEIRATGYLKDPVVDVKFKNFDVIVLGETGGVGTYSFPEGEVNMFELLAKIGDQTEDAQRNNIWVIRTTGGVRKIYSVNPQSKAIYDSPAYFLQQNDMVYFPPKDNKLDKSTSNVLTIITTPLSVLSTIFSGLALIITYSRYGY